MWYICLESVKIAGMFIQAVVVFSKETGVFLLSDLRIVNQLVISFTNKKP